MVKHVEGFYIFGSVNENMMMSLLIRRPRCQVNQALRSASNSCVAHVSSFQVRAPLVCFEQTSMLVKKLSVARGWFFPSTSIRYLHTSRTSRDLRSRNCVQQSSKTNHVHFISPLSERKNAYIQTSWRMVALSLRGSLVEGIGAALNV